MTCLPLSSPWTVWDTQEYLKARRAHARTYTHERSTSPLYQGKFDHEESPRQANIVVTETT